MRERWVKYVSPEHGTDQWVNMANVQHMTARRDHTGVIGTVITFSNDSSAVQSFSYAAEPPEHFLPTNETQP